MTAAPTRPDLLVRRRKDKERRVRQYLHGDLIVPAAPVVAHMRALQGQGWTLRQIADAAQVAHSTPHALAHQELTKRTVAERILRVTGSPPSLSSHTLVDSTGTRRRVQALATLGWSPERIAVRAGISRGPVYRALGGGGVSVSSATAIRVAYDALWDVRATGGRCDVVAARARAAGWAPPLAWDDDTIDDPTASPEGVQDRDPDAAPVNAKKVHVDDIVEQLELDPAAPLRVVAERLGLRKETIRRHLHRHGRDDLLAVMSRNAVAAGCGNQHTARSVAA